ncbi:MAG TPA: FkbM family methyltransferase [Caulobacter sp.]|nr:FkbM family methyltransferase [Caulobacter sp.]
MALRLDAILGFILSHPMNRSRPLAALGRFVGWQLRSRLQDEVVVPWIGGARLAVKRGMTGATGNVYCGLHEFTEMGFLTHLLRPGDLFLDIGANVGSYSVLASRTCGARTIAFEPDPGTAQALRRNIALNGLESLVTVEETALGPTNGETRFTVGRDTVNRIAADDEAARVVPMRRLDDVTGAGAPTMIKLDVEGFEAEVIEGGARVLSAPSLLAIQTELDTPEIREKFAGLGFGAMYYDPFTRTLAEEPLGYRVSNMLYVREPQAVRDRLAAAPHRTLNGVRL